MDMLVILYFDDAMYCYLWMICNNYGFKYQGANTFLGVRCMNGKECDISRWLCYLKGALFIMRPVFRLFLMRPEAHCTYSHGLSFG